MDYLEAHSSARGLPPGQSPPVVFDHEFDRRAVVFEPEDATKEDVGVRAEPVGPPTGRVAVVLAGLVLLAIVVALLVWGLTR